MVFLVFQKLINTHSEFEKSSKEKEKEYEKIKGLEVEIDKLCQQINRESIVNPYTNVTTSVRRITSYCIYPAFICVFAAMVNWLPSSLSLVCTCFSTHFD